MAFGAFENRDLLNKPGASILYGPKVQFVRKAAIIIY